MLNVFLQAVEAVRTNLLRASVTMFIIALGITSLVGVLTSIDGVKYAMASSFSSLGSNTFRIVNSGSGMRMGGPRPAKKKQPVIEFLEAMAFRKQFENKAIVCITGAGNFGATLKYDKQKTNPNVQCMGTDANYVKVYRYTITEGRNFTDDDAFTGDKVIILGSDVRKNLFPFGKAVGEKVNMDNHIYKVIGVMGEVGTSGSMGGDKIVLLPLQTLRSDFPSTSRSFSINVFANDPMQLKLLMEEAKGTFRLIRRLLPGDPENFEVVKSDQFVEELMKNLAVLTLSATLIALITLFGASIALLNVMLVSVTDRTKEIGIRKALGATKSDILTQFLLEAILICQIGGLVGIFLGMGAGNIVSTVLMKSQFVIPWNWIGLGIVLCFIVGVVSGIYPAWKAARVDPIESLRHE